MPHRKRKQVQQRIQVGFLAKLFKAKPQHLLLQNKCNAWVGPSLRQLWGVITSTTQCSTWGCC